MHAIDDEADRSAVDDGRARRRARLGDVVAGGRRRLDQLLHRRLPEERRRRLALADHHRLVAYTCGFRYVVVR